MSDYVKIQSKDFPHAVLTLVVDTDHHSLRVLQAELNANAASVASYGGSGKHGLLALTVPAQEYLELCQTPFIAPVNPPEEIKYPDPCTDKQRAVLERKHSVEQKVFSRYRDADQALVQQVLLAVPDEKTKALKDPKYGYMNVTCLALLTHLWTNYGTISSAQLNKNKADMSKKWSPPTSIETLFEQLDYGIAFAEAGNDPISEATALRDGYDVIAKNPCFEHACREWRNLDPSKKSTLAMFKAHFHKADKDLRENPPPIAVSEVTTEAAGFHANQAVATTHPAAATHVPVQQTPTYCWTHGIISKGGEHNSATCKLRFKNAGHQADATMTNMMGGKSTVFVPYHKARTAPGSC